MNNILDNILHNEESSLCLIEPTDLQYKLFEPIYPERSLKRKRMSVNEFLQEYNKKPEPILIEEDPEQTIEPQSAELRVAIRNLTFKLDPFFKNRLKFHQVEGLQFMWDRVYEKKQGCLLSHSMGLGKTIQVITLLTTMYQYLKENPETKFPTGKRVLILAPMVTLSNWTDEFQKWAIDGVENVIGEVYNISEMKTNQRLRIKYIKYWYTHGGVMLINYDQFRSILTTGQVNDRESCYNYLVNPGPDVIVLDEAHRIKNSSTSLSSFVKKVRTRTRVCLTGYPLQNRLLEYFFMIDFIAPGLLGSKDKFNSYFSNYIDKCYHDSSRTIKEQAAFKLYVLQLLTAHVTHRRGEDILTKDLPPKTEYVVRFKLSPIQHEGYVSLLTGDYHDNPMVALSVLRSICNHPKIFQTFLSRRLEKKRKAELDKLNPEEDEEDNDIIDDSEVPENSTEAKPFQAIQETLDTDLVEENEEDTVLDYFLEDEWIRKYLDNPDIESWKCSGKISFIVDLLKECQIVKEKVVLVSHSLACLDYIQGLLPVFGIKTGRMDGSMSSGERKETLDKFNSDKNIGVMLLSAKASAIGINIVGANRIVLIDQDWNPLYDEQSIGRIYRYGQTKPVIVYRLLTAATIEERIYKQSVHKKSISTRVIDNKQSLEISKDELVDYFQKPDSDLGLIDLETQSTTDLDWISNSALRQNVDRITEFKQYQDESSLKQSTEKYMTPTLRLRAKHDAIEIISEWKNESRLNL